MRIGMPLAESQKPGWRMPIAKGELSSSVRGADIITMIAVLVLTDGHSPDVLVHQ